MIQIRSSVFETNSSSMHSLAIRNESAFFPDEEQYFTKEEIWKELEWYKDREAGSTDDNIILNLCWGGNEDWYFGRAPFKIISSFEDKFRYAFVNFAMTNDKEKFKEVVNQFIDILKEINPNIIEFKYPEFFGVDDLTLPSWMKKYNFDLKEFLFNKKYVVIQDGDEYCIWTDMIKSNLIDKEALENPDGQNLW